MLCYHGTTAAAVDSILSGSGQKRQSCWSCSDRDGMLYVWTLSAIAEAECCETWEEAADMCLDRALESARIQAACAASPVSSLAVLVFDVPDDLLCEDTSAPNMEGSGAMCLPIECARVEHVATYHAAHNPRLDGVIVAGMRGNEWLQVLDPDTQEAAELLAGANVYIEEWPEPYLAAGCAGDIPARFPAVECCA